jgi:nucleolar pre-ribosomal-associated protein 1
LATGGSGSVGLEALQNLDGISVLKTALAFPVLMQVEVSFGKSTVYENQLFDPLFLLLLLQHVLSNGPPTSAVSWIELFRSNVVGLALRALSARDGNLREIGMGCIVAVWTLMQNADLQERDHVLYLLGLLKNAVVSPTANNHSKGARMDLDAEDGEDQARFPPRLPSYTTLLLFHALRGIFNPSTFVYPLTSRFLLQRAELDITDVPMLYSMLYSSDQDDWKKERGWMMRFLADGALTGSGVSDWRLLKRRHVWDLVASMYSSAVPTSSALTSANAVTDVALTGAGTGGDRAFKLSILDFLANLTRHRGPTMSLILKSGLLSWIEAQVLGPDRHAGFGVEWLRILENVMVVVDVGKMDRSALKGQWLKGVARCVDGILQEAMGESFFFDLEFDFKAHNLSLGTPLILGNILPLSIRLIARFSRIESIGTKSLVSLIHQALLVLKALESNVKYQPSSAVPPLDELVPPPQHSSHSLHDKLVFDDVNLFCVWGRSVESLWQSAMSLDPGYHNSTSPGDIWNHLTSRLLVWRGLVGAEASPLGEWARVECIRNLCIGI